MFVAQVREKQIQLDDFKISGELRLWQTGGHQEQKGQVPPAEHSRIMKRMMPPWRIVIALLAGADRTSGRLRSDHMGESQIRKCNLFSCALMEMGSSTCRSLGSDVTKG